MSFPVGERTIETMITSFSSNNRFMTILLILRYKNLMKQRTGRVHSRYRKKYYQQLSAYQRRI